MLIGATVFAVLILLLLLAERGSSRMWRGGSQAALFYCSVCDLRYPVEELVDRRSMICPGGHFTEPTSDGIPFSTIFICACCAFIAVAVLLIASGRVA